MRLASGIAAILILPAVEAAAMPPVPDAPATPQAPVVKAQYRVYDYYEPGPAPQLREFTDQNGNRVFVDEYGDVVSIVPPVERQQDQWGRRGGTDWGIRRVPEGLPDRALEPPPSPYDRYGGYDRRQVAPNYDDYRSFPPAPGPDGVERHALPEPEGETHPEFEGPQPYTPPTFADRPADDGPAAPAAEGSVEVAALQIYLDRAGFSPGVIDGRMGSNVRKALAAYERKTGERLDPNDVEGIMDKLGDTGGLPIMQYTITAEDVAGPFIETVPTDYAEKAELEALSYTSPAELLAERFHMDEDYLREINPNADFSEAGTVIKVADVGGNAAGKVTRIVADKSRKQVLAYGESGNLIAAYPATIGSRSTPSPSGTHSVERIAPDPNYTYNPKINFKQGDNDEVLTIPPGPNGPVGSMWIALSKPTYGIHGTPEPAHIGKTESNGCVRLTNWDARELAGMVEKGVTVEFVEDSELLVSGARPQEEEPAAQQ